RALAAGAKLVRPIADQFYSDRVGGVEDPFGYRWFIATHKEDLTMDETRRRVEHLREQTDVQNIDLMNLAGFCRNCLSKWYRVEAEDRGVALSDPESREIVYGMPYDEWRAKHQKEASPEQRAAFAASQKH